MGTVRPIRQHKLYRARPFPPDAHPVTLLLSRYPSPHTVLRVRGALRLWASALSDGECDLMSLDWAAVRYPDAVRAWAKIIGRKYSPNSLINYRTVLNLILRETWRLGYIDSDTWQRAADLPRVRGSRVPPGRQLTDDELRALFKFSGGGRQGCTAIHAVRHLAILAVMFSTGCRRGELVNLDVADYDPTTGRLLLRGKGNKERIAYIGTLTGREYLADWLTLRGMTPGPLFVNITSQGTRLSNRRLGYWVAGDLFRRASIAANIPIVRTHDARRTFISNVLDAGVDLETAQRLAGHSDPRSTSGYSRRGERAKIAAAETVRLPSKDQL